jgi:hypothetical protein
MNKRKIASFAYLSFGVGFSLLAFQSAKETKEIINRGSISRSGLVFVIGGLFSSSCGFISIFSTYRGIKLLLKK